MNAKISALLTSKTFGLLVAAVGVVWHAYLDGQISFHAALVGTLAAAAQVAQRWATEKLSSDVKDAADVAPAAPEEKTP